MRYLVHSETIARWSVYLLFTLVPFFFVPVPWVAVAQAKMLLAVVLVAVGVLAWVATSLRGETFKVPRSLLLVAGALLPIAYVISAIGTGASWESFVGNGTQLDTVVVVFIWFALFVLCASVLAEREQRVIFAIRVLFLGGIALLLIQFVHLLFPSFTFGGALIGSAATVLGSWHDLGIFLGLLVFLSLASLGTPIVERRSWRILSLGLAILGGAFLLVINFSDVWLGLCGLALFHTLYLWNHARVAEENDRTRARSRALWWILIAAISLGLYWGGVFIHQSLPERLQVVQFEVRPSWKGTYAVGTGALAEPSSVFLGSGPNSFPRDWGLYKPIEVNATQFWNVDFYSGVGFIPTSFVTIGLLGIFAWGAVCLALFLSLRTALFERVLFSELASMRGIVVASALYLALYHILYIPGSALSTLTFMFFGVLVATELLVGSIRDLSLPLSLSQWKGRIPVGVVCVFGVLVLVGSIQLARALSSDALVNHAVYVFGVSQDLGSASRSVARALAIFPNNDRAHRAGVELGLQQLSRLGAQAATSDAMRALLQATLTATIKHGLAAVSIESRNYQNWLMLARLYGELAGVGVEGADKSARDAYIEARKNNVTSPLPYLGLGQLDIIKGDDTSARTNLDAALQIKPDLALAHFFLSQIDARAGDLHRARERAVIVVQLVPQDPLGWYNLGTIFYAEKNYEDATRSLERAAGLQNNYADALFLLGSSYEKLGRTRDALVALRTVSALNPSDATLKKIIGELEIRQDSSDSSPQSE